MSFYAGGGESSSRNTHPDRRRSVNTFSLSPEDYASKDAYFREQGRDEYYHPNPRGRQSTNATTIEDHSYQEARPIPIVGYRPSLEAQASDAAFARELRALNVFTESEIQRQISERNDPNLMNRYLYSQSGSPHDFLGQPRINVELRIPVATAPQPPPSSSSYRSHRTSSRQDDSFELSRQSEPYAEPHIFGFDYNDDPYDDIAPPMTREGAYNGSERYPRDERRH